MKYNKQRVAHTWGTLRPLLVYRSIFTRCDGITEVNESHTKKKNTKRELRDNWKFEYMSLPFDNYRIDWNGEEP